MLLRSKNKLRFEEQSGGGNKFAAAVGIYG